jgi:hypothetical protein
MSSPSATPNTFPYHNEPKWSKSERAIARTAFDAALRRELQDVMQKAKQMANQIREPADVWELERYLTQRRKDIDRRYDFRSSRLTRVFGTLMCESRITEEELRGLGEDKLKVIRSFAKGLSDEAASSGSSKSWVLALKNGADMLDVYLCPESFLKDMGFTFSKGDEIALTGSKVKQENGELILAREIVKGTDTLVLRDNKGGPVWNWH